MAMEQKEQLAFKRIEAHRIKANKRLLELSRDVTSFWNHMVWIYRMYSDYERRLYLQENDNEKFLEDLQYRRERMKKATKRHSLGDTVKMIRYLKQYELHIHKKTGKEYKAWDSGSMTFWSVYGSLPESDWVKERIGTSTAQTIAKQFYDSVKSFKKLRTKFFKQKGSLTGFPKPPSFRRKEEYSPIYTTTSVIGLDKKTNRIKFLSKGRFGDFSIALSRIDITDGNKANIRVIRLLPDNRVRPNYFKVELVFNLPVLDTLPELDSDRYLSIDLGIKNFVTAFVATTEVDKQYPEPFIISGKEILSKLQWTAKRQAQLQAKLSLSQHNLPEKRKKRTSKALQQLTTRRNGYVLDKIHKISKFIIDYCLENKIKTIVIGKNKDWKRNSDIGKKSNQQFVQMPHERFIEKLKYKAEEVGIVVLEQEESYTSKCDALALESVEKHETYSGKRIATKFFVSKKGTKDRKLINADLNGAINILRKNIGGEGLCIDPNMVNLNIKVIDYEKSSRVAGLEPESVEAEQESNLKCGPSLHSKVSSEVSMPEV